VISAPFLPLNHHAQRLVLVRDQLLASPRPRSSLQASSPKRCASALGGCGRAPCAAHLPLWASRRAAARIAAAHIAAAALAPGEAAALAPGGGCRLTEEAQARAFLQRQLFAEFFISTGHYKNKLRTKTRAKRRGIELVHREALQLSAAARSTARGSPELVQIHLSPS